MLAENVDELKSCGLVDDKFMVDDYLDIDFEVCTSETRAVTDQKNLGFVSGNNDCDEEEEEKDEKESEVNDVPLQKPKLPEIANAVELIKSSKIFSAGRKVNCKSVWASTETKATIIGHHKEV